MCRRREAPKTTGNHVVQVSTPPGVAQNFAKEDVTRNTIFGASSIRYRVPVSVTPRGSKNKLGMVPVLSIEGIHRILTGVVTNFTSFAPLGTVLLALIGIVFVSAARYRLA